jgi:hypothetical protein
MIKKYLHFLTENTLGEKIELLYDDEYIKNIVNRYISDTSSTIRLANAINILEDDVKMELKSQIEDYLENGLSSGDEVSITTTTDINEMVQGELSIPGKGVFSSFLKSITALGRKDNKPDYEKCPGTFLLYYEIDNLLYSDVKSIFNRFKSLQVYVNDIDNDKNYLSLYFGVRTDGCFSYGFKFDEKYKMIGKFKLSKSSLNWLLKIDSKSAESLKKEIVNLSPNDIILFGIIKKDFGENKIYYDEKLNPFLKDKILTFGYHGTGTWKDGKILDEDYKNIKKQINDWIISKKWSNKILFNVIPKSFWLYIHIKIK